MSRRRVKSLFWVTCPVALLALSLYLALRDDSPTWMIAPLAFFLLVQVVWLGLVVAAILIERRSGDSQPS